MLFRHKEELQGDTAEQRLDVCCELLCATWTSSGYDQEQGRAVGSTTVSRAVPWVWSTVTECQRTAVWSVAERRHPPYFVELIAGLWVKQRFDVLVYTVVSVKSVDCGMHLSAADCACNIFGFSGFVPDASSGSAPCKRCGISNPRPYEPTLPSNPCYASVSNIAFIILPVSVRNSGG